MAGECPHVRRHTRHARDVVTSMLRCTCSCNLLITRITPPPRPLSPLAQVCDLLLEALLLDEPGVQDDLGYVVDGFPRTTIQARASKCPRNQELLNRRPLCGPTSVRGGQALRSPPHRLAPRRAPSRTPLLQKR